MQRRLWAAGIGMVAGFGIGLLLWALDLFVADGSHHLLGLVVAFTASFGILSFLFPLRVTDSFVRLILGMLESGNI